MTGLQLYEIGGHGDEGPVGVLMPTGELLHQALACRIRRACGDAGQEVEDIERRTAAVIAHWPAWELPEMLEVLLDIAADLAVTAATTPSGDKGSVAFEAIALLDRYHLDG